MVDASGYRRIRATRPAGRRLRAVTLEAGWQMGKPTVGLLLALPLALSASCDRRPAAEDTDRRPSTGAREAGTHRPEPETRTVVGDVDPPEGYTGIWRITHEDGKLYREDRYEGGRLYGKSTVWHHNGKIESVRCYLNGRRAGEARGWYENGSKWYVNHWKDGELHGVLTNWVHEKKVTHGNCTDGKRDGPWLEWHGNGKRKIEGYFWKGERHGPWEEWAPDGRLEVSGEYRHGDPWDGTFRVTLAAKAFGYTGVASYKEGKPWSGGVVSHEGGRWHVDTYEKGAVKATRALNPGRGQQ